MNYASCSPFRVPVARVAAAHAALGALKQTNKRLTALNALRP